MELGELRQETLKIFGASDTSELGQALKDCLIANDVEKLQAFSDMVDGDLSRDWLQMIYQYDAADRKEKKQDFTPANLGAFMSSLAGDAGVMIDMCAGSGALTIQRWNQNHEQRFILYEVDQNVISYLLFNLVLRNIEAQVYLADVLIDETIYFWLVRKGEKYGKVTGI